MRSPYSQQIEFLVREINRHFAAILDLTAPYTREDIIPGDRFGIINFRSFGSDTTKLSRESRAGFESCQFQVEILLTIGCATWIDSCAIAAATMMDLDHAIPAIKQLVEQKSWVYDLQVKGDIVQSMRQSIQTPHYWMVDISCDAVAKMQVYKTASGEHTIYSKSLDKDV